MGGHICITCNIIYNKWCYYDEWAHYFALSIVVNHFLLYYNESNAILKTKKKTCTFTRLSSDAEMTGEAHRVMYHLESENGI